MIKICKKNISKSMNNINYLLNHLSTLNHNNSCIDNLNNNNNLNKTLLNFNNNNKTNSSNSQILILILDCYNMLKITIICL